MTEQRSLISTAWILRIGAALALVVSAVFTPGELPDIGICTFREWVDLPCPGCGLSHSFCAISHGDFGEAWRFNPFGFLFYLIAFGILIWPWLPARFRERMRGVGSTRTWTWVAVAFVLVMWIYGICRIVDHLGDERGAVLTQTHATAHHPCGP